MHFHCLLLLAMYMNYKLLERKKKYQNKKEGNKEDCL